jgi:hypothetical protein
MNKLFIEKLAAFCCSAIFFIILVGGCSSRPDTEVVDVNQPTHESVDTVAAPNRPPATVPISANHTVTYRVSTNAALGEVTFNTSGTLGGSGEKVQINNIQGGEKQYEKTFSAPAKSYLSVKVMIGSVNTRGDFAKTQILVDGKVVAEDSKTYPFGLIAAQCSLTLPERPIEIAPQPQAQTYYVTYRVHGRLSSGSSAVIRYSTPTPDGNSQEQIAQITQLPWDSSFKAPAGASLKISASLAGPGENDELTPQIFVNDTLVRANPVGRIAPPDAGFCSFTLPTN